MAKVQAQFQCRECAGIQPKWSGQCPDCKSWNSIEELPALSGVRKSELNWHGSDRSTGAINLDAVPTTSTPRFSSEITELDRVLGGGLVQGSVVLLGGGSRYWKIDNITSVPDESWSATKRTIRYR